MKLSKNTAPSKRSGPRPVSVGIVDDHVFMRELISARLSREGDGYKIVAEGGDAAEALSMCRQARPDLLILDVNLPDRSGLDIVAELRAVSPQTRILLCSAFPYQERIDECLASGADGFVEKTNTWDDFLEAVKRVGRGERYFCVGNTSSGLRNGATEPAEPREFKLSAREKEVLSLVAEGRTSKEIAVQLGLSVLTVDTHRAHLMTKAGVRNVAGLVLFAVRRGIVDAGRRYRR